MTDMQTLSREERSRLAEYVNAMQNSSGGIISVEGKGEVRVEALNWYEKPIALDGRVWRRIEGQNIISGVWAKSVMASRDSCDDFAVDGAALRGEHVADFRRAVLRLHPELGEFTHDEFMRRTGILSGRHITSAGSLMFGGAITVRAVLAHREIHAEIEAHNIWEAYTVLLPRLTRRLSAKSAESVRAALTTSLISSDYNLDTHIHISILSSPPRIVVDSPGLITPSLRNHRLIRIARLAGIFAAPFEAEHDMLNFRTLSTIHIEGVEPVML